MAPSPEHDNEPKAPDKTDQKAAADTPALRPTTADPCEEPTASNLDLQESSVSTLDDGQLKALLDEAINYKTPKDREGKSKIFKVLLQEAEEDERNARAASASGPQLARYYNTAATRRHRNSTSRRENPSSTVSSRLTHGGSLQDLAQPDLYSDVLPSGHAAGRRSANSRRRTGGGHHLGHHGGAGGVSVSARQREGGSLPSNVNAGAQYDRQLFEEDTASVRGAKPRREKPLKSLTITTPTVAAGAPRMVEAETSSGAAAPTTSPSPSPVRPDYTILDINAEPEETLSLLENEVVHTYDSTLLTEDPLSKFPYQEETYPSPMEVEAVDDNVGHMQHSYPPQHAFEEAIQQHRIPRVRYTSRATLEVDGVSGVVTSSAVAPLPPQTVDKGILFPQFQQQSLPERDDSLQLETEYNSVRCFVESGTAAGLPISAPQMGAQGPQSAGLTGSIVPTQYRLLSMSNSKIIQGVDRYHSDKKGLDENGNAVNTTSTSHVDSKKKKKCKVDRNVTVLKSEQVEGHRADIIEDLDLLVQYIEQNDTDAPAKFTGKHHHNVNNKMTNSKNNHQVENKRRTRVKSKSESVVKKSNSLEEISKTKLEDLMSEDVKSVRSRVKKQSTSEDGDRRSWGTEDGQQYMCGKRQALTDPQDFALTAETDFHVVTKKKKSKKQRRSSSGGRNFDDGAKMNHNSMAGHHQLKQSEHNRAHHRRVFAPDAEVPGRRKSTCSVPPSDKSADSSDVDSVHSLPAEVHHREAEQAAQVATSPPGALTSYADIARTSGAPSNNSSASSNCSSQGGSNNNNNNIQQTPIWKPQAPVQATVPPLTPSPVAVTPVTPIPKNHLVLRSEHFPELCDPVTPLGEVLHRTEEFPTLELQPQAPLQRISPRGPPPQAHIKVRNSDSKLSTSNNSAVNINLKRQSVIRNRTGRPAVIILNDDQMNNGDGGAVSSASDAIEVSGLTFGFELNEQLLNNSAFSDDQCSDEAGGEVLDGRGAGERFIARFLAPISATNLTDAYNHDKIVTFVGLAWEDVVHQTNNGKVQYYNGQ